MLSPIQISGVNKFFDPSSVDKLRSAPPPTKEEFVELTKVLGECFLGNLEMPADCYAENVYKAFQDRAFAVRTVVNEGGWLGLDYTNPGKTSHLTPDGLNFSFATFAGSEGQTPTLNLILMYRASNDLLENEITLNEPILRIEDYEKSNLFQLTVDPKPSQVIEEQ